MSELQHQLKARWLVRWMHRHDLPATAELPPAETEALLAFAARVAVRYTRIYGSR